MTDLPKITPAYLVGAVTAAVGLFATQGFIQNITEKLVCGLAAIIIPVAFVVAHTLFHARVTAARIGNAVPPAEAPVAATVIPVKKTKA